MLFSTFVIALWITGTKQRDNAARVVTHVVKVQIHRPVDWLPHFKNIPLCDPFYDTLWAILKAQHIAVSIHTLDRETHESEFDTQRQGGQVHHHLFQFQHRDLRPLLRLRLSSPFQHRNQGTGVRSSVSSQLLMPMLKEVRLRSVSRNTDLPRFYTELRF